MREWADPIRSLDRRAGGEPKTIGSVRVAAAGVFASRRWLRGSMEYDLVAPQTGDWRPAMSFGPEQDVRAR